MSSSFGKAVVESGRFTWKFWLKRIMNDYVLSMAIGIWKVKSKDYEGKVQIQKPPTDKLFAREGYGYLANAGHLCSTSGWGTGDLYGINCKSGDTLGMTLDLDAMTLEYTVNGYDLGIAVRNITPTAYRAAVMTCSHGFEVEIL